MIKTGTIRKVITPYYDLIQNKMLTKSRPALIIGKADDEDYVVLPISRVTRKYNLDTTYDIEIDPAKYPLLNLRATSYIRTHKRTVIHAGEIGDEIGDLKNNYADLLRTAIERMAKFDEEITKKALAYI